MLRSFDDVFLRVSSSASIDETALLLLCKKIELNIRAHSSFSEKARPVHRHPPMMQIADTSVQFCISAYEIQELQAKAKL